MEKNWYIAIVTNRSEKKVATALQSLGYEVYLPIKEETRMWSQGRKRKVESVVIPAKLFIHTSELGRLQVLNEHVGVLRYMVNISGTPNQYGKRPIAIVPDHQIEQLKRLLENATHSVEFSEYNFVRGEKVRIIEGKLYGYEGIVTKDSQGVHRLHLVIDCLGSFITEIDPVSVEKI